MKWKSLAALLVLIIGSTTATAAVTVLHNFAGGSADPRWPEGSPIIDGATLYATTVAGGTYNKGTVFKIATDGTGFTVLHDFEGDDYDPLNDPDDGRLPASRLALAGGTLNRPGFSGELIA